MPGEIQGAGTPSPIADPLTLQTRRPKIFAAGDLVSGPKSVIEALAQGREAAISIGRFLARKTLQ